MFKIGFSKIDLESSLQPKLEIREPIEAISMYAENDGTRSAWIVLDFMDFNRKYTDTIREKIIDATGIDADHIHILTTHNHGGGTPDLDRLSELCSECVLSAINKKEEARLRYAFTETERQLNILRRLYIPETLGVSTLYFGACEENGFNSSLFAERVVEEIKTGKECNYIGEKTSRPYARFPEGDKEVFILHFINNEEKTIGSIVRFAAHAVTANRPGSYSSDYPYYVRKTVEEGIGGTAMFLNGPCADIAPAMLNKFTGCERTIGEYLGNLALNALSLSKPEQVTDFSDSIFEVTLPVREELLNNRVELPEKMPDSLPERRRFLENKRLLDTLPFLNDKYLPGEKAPGNEISVFLGALRFNDIYFAAFPGETFSSTAKKLKDSYPGSKIVTVTEHERTVMYLPPLEDFQLGGYEAVCKLTAPGSEKNLFEGAKSAFDSFIK